MDTTTAVLSLITQERAAQDEKWGVQDHGNEKWMIILMEEVGEASQAALNGHHESCMYELVQCAAVCVAAVECMARELGTESLSSLIQIIKEQQEEKEGQEE